MFRYWCLYANVCLLHLVGILFPHNNEVARSKSHQIQIVMFHDSDKEHPGLSLLECDAVVGRIITDVSKYCIVFIYSAKHGIVRYSETSVNFFF
jgi:hypothetical protein